MKSAIAPYVLVFALGVALGALLIVPERTGGRGLASCLDDSRRASPSLPLEFELFSEVSETAAQKDQISKTAHSFYNYLAEQEFKYYMDMQSARMSMGIRAPLFNFYTPSIVNQASTLIPGWGDFFAGRFVYPGMPANAFPAMTFNPLAPVQGVTSSVLPSTALPRPVVSTPNPSIGTAISAPVSSMGGTTSIGQAFARNNAAGLTAQAPQTIPSIFRR